MENTPFLEFFYHVGVAIFQQLTIDCQGVSALNFDSPSNFGGLIAPGAPSFGRNLISLQGDLSTMVTLSSI